MCSQSRRRGDKPDGPGDQPEETLQSRSHCSPEPTEELTFEEGDFNPKALTRQGQGTRGDSPSSMAQGNGHWAG